MPSPRASARRRAAELADPGELRPLLVRTDTAAVRYLVGHVAALVVTSFLVYLAWGTWWIVPAWIADGIVIAHLFALQHETAHGTAFKTKRANKVVTTVCGAVLGIAPRYFRLEHIAHHNFTQDPERDPELVGVPRSVLSWLWFVAGGPFWIYQVRTLVPHAFGRLTPSEQAWIPASTRPRIRREAQLMLAGWLVALVVPLYLGSDAFLVWWVVPRLIGEPIMRIARLSEHAGRPQVPDVTVNTRTLDVPWPLRRLAWNMPYHAEHHAFPAVPFHALPQLRQVLAPSLTPAAGGYLAAQVDILRRRHAAT
jgi:fatty acid desaturase